MKSFFSGEQGRALQQVAETLWGQGFVCYLAGGCVRDRLLNQAPKDFDVVTDAQPDQIINLFPKIIPVGKKFGIVVVVQDGYNFEVATFRSDGDYKDGRHPEAIQFASPQEDAHRRDFTVNAIFYDLKNQKYLDFVGGIEDLQNKILRTVGDPHQRFQEDYLRILRALRFEVQLGFTIDSETWLALKEKANQLHRISAERIMQEIFKGVQSSADLFFQRLVQSGVWTVLMENIRSSNLNSQWSFPSVNVIQKQNLEQTHLLDENQSHSQAAHRYINFIWPDTPKVTDHGSALAYLLLRSQMSLSEQAFIVDSQSEVQWNESYLQIIKKVSQVFKISKADQLQLKCLAALPTWLRLWPHIRSAIRWEWLHQLTNSLFLPILDLNFVKNFGENSPTSIQWQKDVLQSQGQPLALLNGNDVLSIEPKNRARILTEALRLQWEGAFTTREEALSWLNSYVSLKSLQ